jgi:hypothetical protein
MEGSISELPSLPLEALGRLVFIKPLGGMMKFYEGIDYGEARLIARGWCCLQVPAKLLSWLLRNDRQSAWGNQCVIILE